MNSVVLPAFVLPMRPILIGVEDYRLFSGVHRIKPLCSLEPQGEGADRHALTASYQNAAAAAAKTAVNHASTGTRL